MHRIVVVGGGAGGLELVTRLGDKYGRGKDVRITLVDRSLSHIWKPLLHEVAAGVMDTATHQLSYVAQANWHHFEFATGEMIGLDRAAKTIRLAAVPAAADEGEGDLLPERTLPYDTLVLAIGSTTNFFGVPGAQEHTIALDTVEQAERFRRRLMAACVRAQNAADTPLQATLSDAADAADAAVPSDTPDAPAGALLSPPKAQRHKVNLVIVGAGATGVELSAELRNTAEVLRSYGLKLDPRKDVRITIIESSPRILKALPERVSGAVAGLLTKLDVDILCGDSVAEVRPNEVTTTSGKVLPADITVWSAGITAPPVLGKLGLAVNRLNQIEVLPTLQSKTDPDIFAFGDCASCEWPEHGFVPPRAQAAHQQASFLVKAIDARLKGQSLPTFTYRDFGSLVSLGKFSAVGNLMGGLIGGSMFIEGLFARVMYTSLYRMHVAALHGVWRMMLDTVANRLRRSTVPRVKLH
ncbi:pyridine nucleotide-disulfide oxidoreductase [Pandoraea vervacti]|uniref:Pyridine nucleotide-disulfide oxidoreductase n=1 Tax=Pandoraea vervacti TaxID=656178 RepID=A0ABN4FXZ7_9BURK|nr:NAD(P)/FAD-dependent oxidoreductase [Pandoraea vervacti]AJP59810.1 pyridine nucleotide-disulfide oxidoreductase [Pandoraea vervacti]